jgi:hypothetical protein
MYPILVCRGQMHGQIDTYLFTIQGLALTPKGACIPLTHKRASCIAIDLLRFYCDKATNDPSVGQWK